MAKRAGTSGPARSKGTDADRAAASLAPVLPPEPFAVQVAKLTLDPGYRAVAVMLDDWTVGCTCMGAGLPPSAGDTLAASLKIWSLDPALAVVAQAAGSVMATCCSAAVTPAAGPRANGIALLTLDPGAIRVAMVLDAMQQHCCDSVVD